ncbi:MAG: hypothetical protein AAB434_08740 [Planctomycetota bacterium]|mgnify:CR=1 FL=1
MRRVWILLLALSVAASAEGKKTAAEWTGEDELTITVRMEFYGKASKSQVAAWERGIEKAWNKNAVAEIEKDGETRKVTVTIVLETRVRKASDGPTEGWHQVKVVSGISEFLKQRVQKQEGLLMDGYRSWMWLGGKEEGDSGCWSNLIWPTVAAHEFGHALGLDDEYDEDAGLLRPILGFLEEQPPSLMNLSWYPGAVAKPRHFRTIVENVEKYGWSEKK